VADLQARLGDALAMADRGEAEHVTVLQDRLASQALVAGELAAQIAGLQAAVVEASERARKADEMAQSK
jgi:hypothetical protein